MSFGQTFDVESSHDQISGQTSFWMIELSIYRSSINPVKCLNPSTWVYFYSTQRLCCTVSTQIKLIWKATTVWVCAVCGLLGLRKAPGIKTSRRNQSIPPEENKESNRLWYNLKRIKYESVYSSSKHPPPFPSQQNNRVESLWNLRPGFQNGKMLILPLKLFIFDPAVEQV